MPGIMVPRIRDRGRPTSMSRGRLFALISINADAGARHFVLDKHGKLIYH